MKWIDIKTEKPPKDRMFLAYGFGFESSNDKHEQQYSAHLVHYCSVGNDYFDVNGSSHYFNEILLWLDIPPIPIPIQAFIKKEKEPIGF
jgi:hypothetical protein